MLNRNKDVPREAMRWAEAAAAFRRTELEEHPPVAEPFGGPEQVPRAAWWLAHELRRVALLRIERMSKLERLLVCLRGPKEVYRRVIGYAIEAALINNRSSYYANRASGEPAVVECTPENPCLDFENCSNCATFPSGSGG